MDAHDGTLYRDGGRLVVVCSCNPDAIWTLSGFVAHVLANTPHDPKPDSGGRSA